MFTGKKNKLLCVACCSVVLASLAGCNPVYSPPVQVTHYGAPGNYENPRKVEAVAAAHGSYDVVPTASFHYRINQGVQLELGSSVALEEFVMQFGGVRLTVPPLLRDRDVKLTMDTEFGLGIGVGGENKCSGDACAATVRDSLMWKERLAWGGYAGVGLGINIKWFDIYMRGRYQQTKATHIPTTSWFSALGGIQFTIACRVKLNFAGGVATYVNDADQETGGFGEVGLGFYFGRL